MNDAASQRALRMQALLLRSAAERAELVHAVTAVRQSATSFGKAAPGLALVKGLPLALGLLKRAPLLRPLLSLVLASVRRPVIRYGVLATGAAFVGWKGWQWLAERRAQSLAAVDSASQPDPDAPE